MKRDPIVLGENYILSGDDVGVTRPNANALIVGTTGCGKSTSVVLPTLARSEYSNPVLSYAKEADAYQMAAFLESKGYAVNILNISNPQKSTVSFDPVLPIESDEEIDALAAVIVHAALSNTVDDYWNAKAKPLLSSLIAAARMMADADAKPGMADVFELFGRLLPEENGSSVSTSLDDMFKIIGDVAPRCYAVEEYNAWHSLPYRTASCVRDTLAAALSTVFPKAIRDMMQSKSKPQLNIQRFCERKEALVLITNAIDRSQHFYANLFLRDLTHQLLKLAVDCPNGELPREIRFIYDDMACSCRVEGLEHDLSLYRSAGLSAIMLLQSESQLEKNYTADGAAIIRQNCAVYAYFPGGFDDRSCEIVSKRMNIPYEDVLYGPLGSVYVMQSGRRPASVRRYDTLNSAEYFNYIGIVNKLGKRPNAR